VCVCLLVCVYLSVCVCLLVHVCLSVCVSAVMKPVCGQGKHCRWLEKMLMLEGPRDCWHPERETDVSSKEEF